MENIKANAHYNLKEVPQALYVNGSIMTYRPDDIISINESISQGINENILILELKINEGKGPMKGTPKLFAYKKVKEGDKMYKQVTILYGDNESLTIEIDILG